MNANREQEIPSRENLKPNEKWDIEALYPNMDTWEKDCEVTIPAKEPPFWPAIASYRGKLKEGPSTVKAALETILKSRRDLDRLFTYAHLRHDEHTQDEQAKAAFDKMSSLEQHFAQEISWFRPELLNLPTEDQQKLLASPDLKDYSFYLERIIRLKPHTLGTGGEWLMALTSRTRQTASRTFRAMNDADFHFGTVRDERGQERVLSHGNYLVFLLTQDRTLRKNAFLQYHRKYEDFANTFTELLSGQIQNHLFEAVSRRYRSCLEASLFPKNIDTSVYHSLIETTNRHLDTLHRYLALRKKVLEVDTLHAYDLYVPLVRTIDMQMEYEDASKSIIESVAVLGKDYQKELEQGLLSARWVDRYETKSKRSGAYSSGCYDSHPYILMNYKGTLRDVFTLSHEAGHSMHTHLSRSHQPYHMSNYPIFLAEVASTFHEDLLIRHLLAHTKKNEEKIFLINHQIEAFRGTFFRQVMFAEFELLIHTLAEKRVPLTPTRLREEYRTLNEKYFGKEVTMDSELEIEWARIPHFYFNFYVYQYATGISAATALANKVSEGGKAEREAYLNLLKGGYSRYSIDMLDAAGVDMRTPAPFESAIGRFEYLVSELENHLLGAAKAKN